MPIRDSDQEVQTRDRPRFQVHLQIIERWVAGLRPKDRPQRNRPVEPNGGHAGVQGRSCTTSIDATGPAPGLTGSDIALGG